MTQAPRAIVTGSAGWLGQRLVQSLLQGLPDRPDLRDPSDTVRALTLTTEHLDAVREDPRLDVVRGDLRDAATATQLLDGARGAVVYHAAGVIHPRRVRDFYDVNVTGTRHVLEAAKHAGVQRVVVVSSNSPIGVGRDPDDVFDESRAYAPYLGYGKSKHQMEELALGYARRGDLDVVIVRPPWFYGPLQPARQTLFFEMIRDGKGPIVGGGGNRRSMGYVDNLCQGLILAGRVPEARGQVYWIADRRPYTMNEIIDTVERLLESEFGMRCAHRRLRLPNLASGVAWLADVVIQGLGLYHQKLHVLGEMNKTIACSIAKAERELGYQPSVELEEGMRRSIAWCVDAGRLPRA